MYWLFYKNIYKQFTQNNNEPNINKTYIIMKKLHKSKRLANLKNRVTLLLYALPGRKYKLTNEAKELSNGMLAYRIVALKDFADVKKGDKGGFIQKSRINLSQWGTCWVYDDAVVWYDARCIEDAQVRDSAEVAFCSVVGKGSVVEHDALVHYSARVPFLRGIKAHGVWEDYLMLQDWNWDNPKLCKRKWF